MAGPRAYGIGRAWPNLLDFPDDSSLADDHTALLFDGKRWFVSQADAANLTTLDGVPVRVGYTFIPSGSIVRCGRQAFRIRYPEDAPVALAERAALQPDFTEVYRRLSKRDAASNPPQPYANALVAGATELL